MRALSQRLRKPLAILGVLVWLSFYIWAASTLSARVPEVWWAKVLYFAIVGTAWGLPLLPLIKWAEGGRAPKP